MAAPGLDVVIARKLAKPTFGVVKAALGKAFAPLEEERLSKALGEAVADVSPGSGFWHNHVMHVPRSRSAKKALKKEIATSDALLVQTPSAISSGTDRDHKFDWRRTLAEQLASTMMERQNADDRNWRDFAAGRSPDEWGAAVARALELRMAGDDKLRPLLARLDWGDEQAVHIVVANSLDDMRSALWKIVAVLGVISTGIAELVDKT
jgi:hypothetical protein